MYLIIAFAVTVLVIMLAWRGVGMNRGNDDTPPQREQRPSRPIRYPGPRPTAPDDDPDFLREIDRKLRGGEDKNS